MSNRSESYALLINAIESRENLIVDYVLNIIFEENSTLKECKPTEPCAHSLLHGQRNVNCFSSGKLGHLKGISSSLFQTLIGCKNAHDK